MLTRPTAIRSRTGYLDIAGMITLIIGFGFFLVFLLCSDSQAAMDDGSVTLAWDASTGPNVTGYKLYYGPSSRNYPSVVDVGNQTTYTMAGVAYGQPYYVAVTAYTAQKVESAPSQEVSFTIFNVTASAGSNGGISPSGSMKAFAGAGQTLQITPDPHHHIADVLVNGVSVGPVSSYTLSNITSNYTIAAAFAIDTVNVTASTNGNGTISPSGSLMVNYGSDLFFTITPGDHYHVADVTVDGTSVGAASGYTLTQITGSHNIAAVFAVDSFNIAASAAGNGSISPSGPTRVNYGSDLTYTITPNAHYHVADVLVDGVSVGAVTTHTLNNVAADHTISASFAIDSLTITASAGNNGKISPSGGVKGDYGSDQTFTITPDAHYRVADVLVDGASVGAVTTHTLSKIAADHTISANFALIEGSATLAWDSSTDSNVRGYKVHYGNSSRNYSSHNDAGSQTTYKLSGLTDGQTYYAAATAYNAGGQESAYSTEIAFTIQNGVPVQTSSAPAQQAQATLNLADATGARSPELTAISGAPSGTTHKAPPGDAVDKKEGKDETQGQVPQYNFIAGLGSDPKNGGWVEVIAKDRSYKSPIKINWPEYNALSGAAHLAACDLDGDGNDEVIIGFTSIPGQTGIPGGNFEILAHNLEHLAWGKISWPDYNRINGETRPACGDIDGDGKLEILIGLGPGGKGKVEIFDYTAKGPRHKAWAAVSWKDYNTANGEVRPAAGDLNWDGKAEIILGLGPVRNNASLPAGAFEVLDDKLTHLAWGKVRWDVYNKDNGETRPACGDLNGDGKDEIVIGLGPKGAGRFEILDFDSLSNTISHLEWHEVPWQDYRTAFGETRPVCGNIDSDAEQEILIGLGKGGRGYIGLFEDGIHSHTFMDTLKIRSMEYNKANGECWPALISRKQRQ